MIARARARSTLPRPHRSAPVKPPTEPRPDVLHLDRKIGERVLIKNEHGDGCWLIVSDIFVDRGITKVKLSFDGDRTAFAFTREELLTRDSIPAKSFGKVEGL